MDENREESIYDTDFFKDANKLSNEERSDIHLCYVRPEWIEYDDVDSGEIKTYYSVACYIRMTVTDGDLDTIDIVIRAYNGYPRKGSCIVTIVQNPYHPNVSSGGRLMVSDFCRTHVPSSNTTQEKDMNVSQIVDRVRDIMHNPVLSYNEKKKRVTVLCGCHGVQDYGAREMYIYNRQRYERLFKSSYENRT